MNKIVKEQWMLDIDLLEQHGAEADVLEREAKAVKRREEIAKELESAAKKDDKARELLLKGASITETGIATGLSEAHIKNLINGEYENWRKCLNL